MIHCSHHPNETIAVETLICFWVTVLFFIPRTMQIKQNVSKYTRRTVYSTYTDKFLWRVRKRPGETEIRVV